jgi:two-component system alkaline phosphatase synthesis response regulator PhoP
MNKKILLLDDDDDFLAVTAKVLSQIGKFEVVSTADSENAMELIRKEKPDLLLLDIMMPKVDGFTICKKVKEAPELKHIKVIVYSAKIFDVDKKKALKLGADAYVSKVIESGKLMDTIHQVLNT